MISLLKKYKKTILICAIPYILLLIPLVTRTNYEVDLPGSIRPIENVISIDTSYTQEGSFNSTFVISYRNATLFQKFICERNDKYTVTEISDFYSYLTSSEANMQSQISKEASIQQSIIAVYNNAALLSTEVSFNPIYIGKFVYHITENKKSGNNELEIGDIILGSSEEDVSATVKSYLKGEISSIKILRGDKNKRIEMEISPSIINAGSYLELGIYLYYDYYDLSDVSPAYTVVNSNVGGDSGGLMQALSIYNRLTSFDYSLGYTIAGTGGIDVDGNVYAIGSIVQKIYTAYQNNVDIFFIPYSSDESSSEYKNYIDATNTYNKLKNPKFKLVPVKTLYEAITYLENLGDVND